MTQQACIISGLSLEFPTRILYQQLNFSLNKGQLSALTGRNGQGKSMLMQMLHSMNCHTDPSGNHAFTAGNIHWNIPHSHLPQLHRLQAKTIADALEIKHLHDAFQRIENAVADMDDYNTVQDSWHLPALWEQQLAEAALPACLDFPVHKLSEGEKTRLALMKLFLKQDHYLLLDEPANHLDHKSRRWLLEKMRSHAPGVLLISHDVQSLDHAEQIYELSGHGLQCFQGNYSDFSELKQLHTVALEEKIAQEKRELKQLRHQQHTSLMKSQKRQSHGQALRDSGSQAKILLDYQKDQAGKSLGKLRTQQQNQMDQVQATLKDNQQQLEHVKAQRFYFPFTVTHTSREVLRVSALILPSGTRCPVSLSLRSDQKLHIRGENGSGKSTLLKLIHQKDSATIYCAAGTVYLDQNFSFLNTELSALENLKLLSPEVSESEWRRSLGQLRLSGDKPLQPLSQLSGGEQLKVGLLAISQMLRPDHLLLLDEAENHLDIESRQLLAHAVRTYSGAVLLVSHDDCFVRDCGITESVELKK
ncbi:ATP-binding cassette domain-containing protein [Acinetobacter chinensis]|jgi:ATPase subunit of ABC transporter with duplicated ATPase domains|uniref:ATP-binding cassette domain-containing protein n=1 Tax=Acinetobacter chinensis TaxID=2004650 RepID=UPI002935177C|nr:ATP-binding cassette domain-containing protein [Acinetobacter chinensis]WOE43129.1 ATP-binding cassette domain-containing protein [Acinetobacter chinensis]